MKKLMTLLALTVGFAVLAPTSAEARDSHRHHSHSSHRSHSHNCSSCGGSVYRERVLVGYDRHGCAIYSWRTVSHHCSSGHGHGHGHHHHSGGRHFSFPGFHIDFGR